MGSCPPEWPQRSQRVRQGPGGCPPSESDPSHPGPLGPSTGLVDIFASNITMWGPKAEEFLAATCSPIWVVTETHLVGHRFHDLKARMLKKGWDLYPAHATPNTKSNPGAAALELGADPGKATTGGVLVAARRWLGTTSLCPSTKDGVPGFVEPVGNNFSFMSWRTAGLTIAIGGIYLEPGLGPQGSNLERLAEVATFLTQIATPFILAGDFNMEPAELMGTQWAHKIGAQIVRPDVPFTCSSGEGRVLDYFVVSKGLLPALRRITCSDATPWRPHLGLTLSIQARPREVFLLQAGSS